MRLILCIASIFILSKASANSETCSRIAVVNYQEVLVDSSSSNPGEGLRFYLDKDSRAKDLLDEYQARSKPSWKSAVISTTGTLMILSGLLSSGDTTIIANKDFMLWGGISVLISNYLYSRIRQSKNEIILKRSVDEYNKRNLPKIYFSPFRDGDKSIGVGIGISKEF